MHNQDNISEAGYMASTEEWDEPQRARSDHSKPSRIINGVRAYRCTRCGQYKPESGFYKDSRVPCGVRDKCKACYHK